MNILRQQGNTYRRPDTPVQSLDHNFGIIDHDQNTASSIIADQEQHRLINVILSTTLDDVSRKIVTLRIHEALTWQEIADQLDVTIDQVRYRFEISLDKLKKHLSEDDV